MAKSNKPKKSTISKSTPKKQATKKQKYTAVKPIRKIGLKTISEDYLWSLRVRTNYTDGKPVDMNSQYGGTFTDHQAAADFLNKHFVTDTSPFTAEGLAMHNQKGVENGNITMVIQSRDQKEGMCKVTLWNYDKVRFHREGVVPHEIVNNKN
jgi:hypothetical protein